MMGDYQVRFCERLGVKFPLPTRPADRCAAYKKSQRSVKHICFFANAKSRRRKPKELALSKPTTRQ